MEEIAAADFQFFFQFGDDFFEALGGERGGIEEE